MKLTLLVVFLLAGCAAGPGLMVEYPMSEEEAHFWECFTQNQAHKPEDCTVKVSK